MISRPPPGRAAPGSRPRNKGSPEPTQSLMSATDLTTPQPSPAAPLPPSPAPAPSRIGAAAWLRVALACALLLGSAGVRAWQVRRIEGELREGRERPRIDLSQVPLTLGRWQG